MKLRWKIALVLGVFVALAICAILYFNKQSQTELEKYKATLRAQGEILEVSGLIPAETNTPNDLSIFTDAADPLQSSPTAMGEIKWIISVTPGFARLISRENTIPVSNEKRKEPFTWGELTDALEKESKNLETIRTFLKNAPSQLKGDYKDVYNFPQNPFILKRVAGQWLAASALKNVHDQNPKLTVRDVQALCQLAKMHEHDPTLINAMIRVALTGLTINPTWEAIHGITNWTDADLKEMQASLEQIDLLKVIEQGYTAERNVGLMGFETAFASANPNITGWPSQPNAAEKLAGSIWRSTVAHEDALFYLRTMQGRLQGIRNLRQSASYKETRPYDEKMNAEFERILGSWQKYRYLFSAISIPSLIRAIETTVQNESMRRLTVTAIAIKRYELRHSKLPQDLQSLVPEFLAAVPIDCMDGKPLRYKLNNDGTFLLYSVGKNGTDEGGDPADEDKSSSKHWAWSGTRDIVWPKPALP